MKPVHLVALGALAAALAGPVGAAAAVLAPAGKRRWFLLGAALVSASLLARPDPYAGRMGQPAVVEGRLKRGIVWGRPAPVWTDLYPRPEGEWVRVAGRLARPRPPRNPGELDLRRWLLGLGVRAALEDSRLLARRRIEGGLREEAERRLVRGLSPEVAALARALTLGQREALGPDQEAFRRAGLAHLLALSGLHVGILALFLTLALYPLGRLRYPAVALVLLGYLALVGPSPSLVRATLMALAGLLHLYLGRGRIEADSALALALAAQLTLAPHAVHSLSFQLSYLAVLGMVVLLPPLAAATARLAAVPRYLAQALAATLAAQAAVAPLVLAAFHRLPLASPLANLLALPLTTVFVPLGFLKLLGLPLLERLMEPVGQGLLAVARGFSRGPMLTWGEISPSGMALYYLALSALAAALWGRLAPRRAALVVLLATLAAGLPGRLLPQLELWQLDLGRDQATLIRAPGAVEVLVDAGSRRSGGRVTRALAALGVDELDLLVLSRPEGSRSGGALRVLESLPVGGLLVSALYPEDRVLARARELGVPVYRVSRGDRVELGGLSISVWGPPAHAPPEAAGLVLGLRWRGRRVGLLGGLPERYRDLLPKSGCEVLVTGPRVPGEETLAACDPRVVLVGGREGAPGDPRVYLTGEVGAVRVALAPLP